MSHEWFVRRKNYEHGPLSPDQLKQLAVTGKLTAADMVRRSDKPGWFRAEKVKGLFEIDQPVPPPLPTASTSPAPAPVFASFDSPGRASDGESYFKFNWRNWNIGGKTIFVATCVAVLSMLTKWVEFGPFYKTGLQQVSLLFLGVFIYPGFMLLRQQHINRIGGIACAVCGVVLAGWYISWKSGELLGRSVNLSGMGPVVFIFASIGLLIGVLKYQPPSGSARVARNEPSGFLDVASTAKQAKASMIAQATNLSKQITTLSTTRRLLFAATFCLFGGLMFLALQPGKAIPVDLIQMWNEYHANSVAADMKYKGRHLVLTGIGIAIKRDFSGRPFLSLNNIVHCYFSDESEIASIDRGVVLKIRGVCEGREEDDPHFIIVLRRCSVERL